MNEENISPEQVNALLTHSGNFLSSEEIIPIINSALTKIIVLAGPPESGKTTILTYIYNIFQKESFCDLYFAGSKTLIQFDKNAHRSKIISGLSIPDTERTKVKNPSFLHFVFFDRKEGFTYPFLFTDISGEKFDEIKNSSSDCKNFHILKRCDSFSLLFDGKGLMGRKTRNSVRVDGICLLRNCLDSDMLNRKSHVDIIFSKYDLIIGNKEAESFVEEIEKEIIQKFSKKIGKLRFFKICARSTDECKFNTGSGIDEILLTWIRDKYLPFRTTETNIEIYKTSREFLKYTFRTQ